MKYIIIQYSNNICFPSRGAIGPFDSVEKARSYQNKKLSAQARLNSMIEVIEVPHKGPRHEVAVSLGR